MSTQSLPGQHLGFISPALPKVPTVGALHPCSRHSERTP